MECAHPAIQTPLYNHWEADPHTRRYRNELLRYFHLLAMLPKRNSQILDVGCGTGYMSVLLAKQGFRVTAIDIRKESLVCFETQAKIYGIRQIHGDLFHLHLEPVEAILCQEVLEHIQDLKSALQKIASFLKPGGVGLFCVPYRENLEAKKVQCPSCGLRVHKNGHVHSFTEHSFPEILQEAGFCILSVRRIVNKRTVKWLTRFHVPIHHGTVLFDQVMNGLFPYKSAYLAVLTQKPMRSL